jgi:hypothetical protein
MSGRRERDHGARVAPAAYGFDGLVPFWGTDDRDTSDRCGIAAMTGAVIVAALWLHPTLRTEPVSSAAAPRLRKVNFG